MRHRERTLPMVAWALMLLTTSGCGRTLTFHAHTVVTPGGAVTRTVRISGEDRRELEAAYVLPPGGVWRTEAGSDAPVPSPMWIYERQHPVPWGAPMPPDYMGRSVASIRAATNAPRVGVRRYGIATTYEYEDHFRDVATAETFRAAFRRMTEATRHDAAVAIAAASNGGFTPEQAAAALTRASESQLDELRASMRQKGPRKALEETEWLDDWNDQLVEKLLRDLPASPATNAADWRHALEEALTGATAGFELSPSDEEDLGIPVRRLSARAVRHPGAIAGRVSGALLAIAVRRVRTKPHRDAGHQGR